MTLLRIIETSDWVFFFKIDLELSESTFFSLGVANQENFAMIWMLKFITNYKLLAVRTWLKHFAVVIYGNSYV